jgi:hypothetical protein
MEVEFANARLRVALKRYPIFLGHCVAYHCYIYSAGARSSRDPDAISQSLIPRNPRKVHRRFEQATVVSERILARLSRENGNVAGGGVGSLNATGLIVEIRGALLKNAERWEFKLIHAGVAGAFQQKVWI